MPHKRAKMLDSILAIALVLEVNISFSIYICINTLGDRLNASKHLFIMNFVLFDSVAYLHFKI